MMNISWEFFTECIKMKTESEIVHFFKTLDLIPPSVLCKFCSINIFIDENDVFKRVYCPNCSTRNSLLQGYYSKMKFNQFHFILISYLNNEDIVSVEIKLMKNYMNISRKTIAKYYKKFRTLITNFMENYIMDVVFTEICEIDESMITAKRLGEHGRIPKRIIWVFGILERNSKRCLIYLVPDRRRQTINPIIEHHINNGTLIISDEYPVYVNNRTTPKTSQITHFLPNKHFYHRWINHSINFVNPFDETIHINTLERLWQDLRPAIKSKKNLDEIYAYINEFMFFSKF